MYTPAGAEACTHLLPLPVGARPPHDKMKMREKCVAGFAAVAYELTLLHGIAGFYQYTIEL